MNGEEAQQNHEDVDEELEALIHSSERHQLDVVPWWWVQTESDIVDLFHNSDDSNVSIEGLPHYDRFGSTSRAEVVDALTRIACAFETDRRPDPIVLLDRTEFAAAIAGRLLAAAGVTILEVELQAAIDTMSPIGRSGAAGDYWMPVQADILVFNLERSSGGHDSQS